MTTAPRLCLVGFGTLSLTVAICSLEGYPFIFRRGKVSHMLLTDDTDILLKLLSYPFRGSITFSSDVSS